MIESINEKLKNRRGVLLYYSFFHALDSLSDEMLGKILREFMAYSETGDEPKFADNYEHALFAFLKNWDDLDNARYQQITEKRRAAGTKGAEKRWGNGKRKEGIA